MMFLERILSILEPEERLVFEVEQVDGEPDVEVILERYDGIEFGDAICGHGATALEALGNLMTWLGERLEPWDSDTPESKETT